ncbi:MAG: VTT domain-containing protein [Deinococcota bacterium]|nr:VTT domain-containing protein [Deinococcota bacterium]
MLEALSSFIHDAGPLGPLLYILLFLLTALLPFIPTPLVSTLGGSLLGVGPAILYGTVGLALGAALALNLSRRLGRPVILRLVSPKLWHEWEQFLGIKSLWIWGVIFFVLNIDFAVVAAGLSNLSLRRLWLTAMIARIPWIVLTAWFGDAVLQSDRYLAPALGLIVVIFAVLQLVRARFRRLLVEKVPEVAEVVEVAEVAELEAAAHAEPKRESFRELKLKGSGQGE